MSGLSAWHIAVIDRLRGTVDKLRMLSHTATLDTVERLLWEDDVSLIEFHTLDSMPGLWGYSGDWHSHVRQLRNTCGYTLENESER